MDILKVTKLSKNFGGVKALTDINFTMKKNKITSIIGPNGAGKTTLFNTISGFYEPDEGDIYFLNKNIKGYSPDKIAKEGIMRTFQNIRLFKDLSVVENILIGMHLKLKSNIFSILFKTKSMKIEEKKSYKKVLDLIDYVGLNGLREELAKNLSYGDQRKLEIARSLASEPQIIMLDEPAAGLNSKETIIMKDLILKIKRDKNCSILLIEHDMKLVMGLSDTIIVLNYGKLISEGEPDYVKNDKNVINAYLGEPDEYDDFIA
ncbi:MAG: ABC transporter ATP-binding protein [Clostridiales bacterium]